METIFISKDKIKIMLSDVEMAKYRIHKDFSKDKAEADLIIWDILDDAAASTGFDTEKGSFYVQMFPSKDGGCELFVTRITAEDSINDTVLQKHNMQSLKRSLERPKKELNSAAGANLSVNCSDKNDDRICTTYSSNKKKYIYAFSEFEALLGACREISLSQQTEPSLAYYDEFSEHFYLLLSVDSYQPSEFGAVKCKLSEADYISEHCILFSENAVSDLGKFAV